MARNNSNLAYRKGIAAYKDCFSSPNGQLVFNDLKANTMDRSSYAKGDPYQTAYNEGRRSVFLDIVAAISQANELERKSNAGNTATDSDTDPASDEPESE